MKALKFWLLLYGTLFCITISSTYAQNNYEQSSDIPELRRIQRNYGFDIGAGQPFPALLGAMAGLNIGTEARVSLGAGSLWYWWVYQLDAKFFLTPKPLAPYIGAGVDYIVGRKAEILGWKLKFDRNVSPYIEVGLDYLSAIGFHLGFNVAIMVPVGTILVMPGMLAGWWF